MKLQKNYRPRRLTTSFLLLWMLIGTIVLSGFFYFKVWTLVIPMISNRLNISNTLAEIVFVSSLFHISICRRWCWKIINLPIYRANNQANLCINLVGGLMPIAIAVYQFWSTPPLAILGIALAVATLCYFSAITVPPIGIFLLQSHVWLIASIAALLAGLVVPISPQRLDASAAFAGSVLGCFLGADLLHLKDLFLKTAPWSLSIGGAGLRDGILVVSLISLCIAEWFPKIGTSVSFRFPFVTGYDSIVACLICGAIFLLSRDWTKIRLQNARYSKLYQQRSKPLIQLLAMVRREIGQHMFNDYPLSSDYESDGTVTKN